MSHPHGSFTGGIPPEVWASAFADEIARKIQVPSPPVTAASLDPRATMANAKICASLPSSECAFELVQGNWGALPQCVLTTLGRAVLIGAGMAVLGERQNLVRNSLGGALGIECFVLGWAYLKTRPMKGAPS